MQATNIRPNKSSSSILDPFLLSGKRIWECCLQIAAVPGRSFMMKAVNPDDAEERNLF